jgi:gentisate 1,2-dioxygenase
MATNPQAVVPPTQAQGRARLYDPANFFAFRLDPVPRRQFVVERDQAFAPDAGTTTVLLDASDALGTPYPATTPMLLCRYIRIRANDSIDLTLNASGCIYYVMRGHGTTVEGDEVIEWGEGDAFLLAGGRGVSHRATDDAVLFLTSNEPLLSFESLQPTAEHARVRSAHWTREAIEATLDGIYARPENAEASGKAVQLGTELMAPATWPVPSMNVAINTLQPGGDQRPHRHNGVAVTLAIQGEGVYSMIEDERIDWSTRAAQVTPATELHSHHNRGSERMVSLVIQDEGLHFYTRTPGFSWT